MIEVAGVTVPRAAITRLAVVLHHNGGRMTGHRLGQAIDKNLDRLALTAQDAQLIVAALREHPIDELEPLRQILETSSNGNRR
jgi:hypothetical protein